MPKARRKPAYTLHAPSGQARCRIDGKDHYLGVYDSKESHDRYDELIAEWTMDRDTDHISLLVDELCIRFIHFADEHYRHKDGRPTGEAKNMRHALRFLVKAHGRCRVRDFGPVKLKEVRNLMTEAGMCRTNINRTVHRVRRAFAWGVEEELVPVAVYQALCAVRSLKVGRTTARESEPIKPVDDHIVDLTIPHLSSVVADMVRLQNLCGMRPGEVCALRPCDLTVSVNDAWVYQPATHKTQYRGKDRRVPIGPEGQKILQKYLERDPEAYCFSPVEAEAARNASKRQNRQSPMTPSQQARKPKGRVLLGRYTKDTYNRAVQRACEQAFGMPEELRDIGRTLKRMKDLPDREKEKVRAKLSKDASAWRAKYCWNPNQLRHSAATRIRQQFGIEAAQTVLGHSDPRMTEVYAERNFELASQIMQQIG